MERISSESSKHEQVFHKSRENVLNDVDHKNHFYNCRRLQVKTGLYNAIWYNMLFRLVKLEGSMYLNASSSLIVLF